MTRTPREDLEASLRDPEFAKLYGAELAKGEIALAIAAARHERGMTQGALAEVLGLSQPYVARLESGEANPTIGKVGTLLAVLGFQLSVQPTPLLAPA